MIAQYTIPVGPNTITITFEGKQKLLLDDFAALIEFIQFAKLQHERKMKQGK